MTKFFGYTDPIEHRHEDGTQHAHGGSDDRELNKFLWSVGQDRERKRPAGTYGDNPTHSHQSLSLVDGTRGPNSGPVVWSERLGEVAR